MGIGGSAAGGSYNPGPVTSTGSTSGGGNSGGGTGAAGVMPPQPGFSPFPNQQVAPLTGQQQAGMGLTSALTAPTQNYLSGAMGQQANTIAGQYLDPNSNPFLNSYYNAAALPMIQNYQNTVAPNLLSNFAQSGTVGGTGQQEAFQNAESALGQGLGNLGANIYEPAYMGERQLQQNAAQDAPSLAGGQYLPSQELMQSGQIGQQQAQNVLQAQYENLYNQANWPFQALGMLGQGLGTAAGPGGTGVTIGQPYAGAGGK